MHNLKQEKPKKSVLARHSKFVRSLPLCLASRFRKEKCEGLIQSCHIRDGFYCMADKPIAREIPMCAGHHRIQHQIGEKAFWGKLLDRAKRLASDLWENTGNWEKACSLLIRF